MSDRLTPPEKIPPDDWLKIQRIEKDRSRKEEEEAKAKDTIQRPLLFAAFVVYFRKILNSLFPQSKEQISSVDKQHIFDDLAALKKMLQILGNEDQSRNPEFIQQLSELWHNLLDDCNILNLSIRKNDAQNSKFNELIDSIQRFPPTEDHTLGYYLTEYVGAEWLPFPFMDMLNNLHTQHQKNFEKSQIALWISAIDDLLSSLRYPEEIQ